MPWIASRSPPAGPRGSKDGIEILNDVVLNQVLVRVRAPVEAILRCASTVE